MYIQRCTLEEETQQVVKDDSYYYNYQRLFMRHTSHPKPYILLMHRTFPFNLNSSLGIHLHQ